MRFIKLKPIEWEEPSDTLCQGKHDDNRTISKINTYSVHIKSEQNNKSKGALARLVRLFDRKPDPIDDFTQNYLTLIEDPLARSLIHWLGGWHDFCLIAVDMNSMGVERILPRYKDYFEVKYFFNENHESITDFIMAFSAHTDHLDGKRLLNECMGYNYEDIDKAARSMLGDDVQYTQVFTDLARWAIFNATLSLCVDYAVYHVVN